MLRSVLSLLPVLMTGLALCLATGLRAQADETVYAIAQKMPEFPGGMTGFRTYLLSNFEFPEELLTSPVDGPVQVSFVVMKDGSITKAQVVRGQHPALDKEALRLVNGMPNWIPGEQNGQKVNVLYSMPLRFAMPKKVAAAQPQRTVQAAPAKP